MRRGEEERWQLGSWDFWGRSLEGRPSFLSLSSTQKRGDTARQDQNRFLKKEGKRGCQLTFGPWRNFCWCRGGGGGIDQPAIGCQKYRCFTTNAFWKRGKRGSRLRLLNHNLSFPRFGGEKRVLRGGGRLLNDLEFWRRRERVCPKVKCQLRGREELQILLDIFLGGGGGKGPSERAGTLLSLSFYGKEEGGGRAE